MELSAKEPSSKRAWRIVRICESRDAVHPILLLQSLMVDKLFSGIGNIATQWILSLAGDRPGLKVFRTFCLLITNALPQNLMFLLITLYAVK